uniref:Small integral membrane protein 31 n=1 Tax=Lates calcarifer TaxID=8187 RepID=A0A4W6ELX2_LATCA
MELPFTGFELTFIIVAFIIFSLFSLASVCIQPQGAQPGTESPLLSDTHRQMSEKKKKNTHTQLICVVIQVVRCVLMIYTICVCIECSLLFMCICIH